jgi:hypothetical protein
VCQFINPSLFGYESLTLSQDPGAFDDLQRAAKLSSAAYSGCVGKAFDVTITKTIRDVLTDTNVRILFVICSIC